MRKKNVFFVTDTFIDQNLCNPKYNPDKQKIYVPSTGYSYNQTEVLHEVIHHLQKVQLDVLDYDNCSSNNEFEAYVVNDIIHKYEEDAYGPNTAKIVSISNEEIWNKFTENIYGHITFSNNIMYYDQTVSDAIRSTDWKQLAEVFRMYNESVGNVASEYYKHYTPDYQYKIEELLQAIGVKKKQEQAQ